MYMYQVIWYFSALTFSSAKRAYMYMPQVIWYFSVLTFSSAKRTYIYMYQVTSLFQHSNKSMLTKWPAITLI